MNFHDFESGSVQDRRRVLSLARSCEEDDDLVAAGIVRDVVLQQLHQQLQLSIERHTDHLAQKSSSSNNNTPTHPHTGQCFDQSSAVQGTIGSDSTCLSLSST